tara:strand:+ start:580 stop:756 length:177 start_codon:yes stop_codon:yes gene_type:complete
MGEAIVVISLLTYFTVMLSVENCMLKRELRNKDSELFDLRMEGLDPLSLGKLVDEMSE